MAFGRQGPSGPRKPDPVKGAIAESVQLNALPFPVIRAITSSEENDAIDIEVHVISPTEWQYRVKTQDHGTRYFKLKLSEML